MSQAEALASLDAQIMAAMQSVGLADRAAYVVGVASTDVDVLIDLAAETAGEFGGVGGTQITVTLQRAQVTPERLARIVIDGPPQVIYELRERIQRDESLETWQALKVTA